MINLEISEPRVIGIKHRKVSQTLRSINDPNFQEEVAAQAYNTLTLVTSDGMTETTIEVMCKVTDPNSFINKAIELGTP